MRDTLVRAWPKLERGLRRAWSVAWRAVVKYTETDGEQRAASFAYYAFFSIFPLLLLLVSIGAMFLDEDKAVQAVMNTLGNYIPVEPGKLDALGQPGVAVVGYAVGIAHGIGQPNWFVTVVESVIQNRQQAGLVAFLLLAWSAVRFFQALVRGVNKAWGTKEYSWWRLPIKNLAMVGIVASALFLGVLTPSILNLLEFYFERYFWENISHLASTREQLEKYGDLYNALVNLRGFLNSAFWLARKIIPTLVLFYGFAMF